MHDKFCRIEQYKINKTKDWALVQNAALTNVAVNLGSGCLANLATPWLPAGLPIGLPSLATTELSLDQFPSLVSLHCILNIVSWYFPPPSDLLLHSYLLLECAIERLFCIKNGLFSFLIKKMTHA